jgi:hypothetical protein
MQKHRGLSRFNGCCSSPVTEFCCSGARLVIACFTSPGFQRAYRELAVKRVRRSSGGASSFGGCHPACNGWHLRIADAVHFARRAAATTWARWSIRACKTLAKRRVWLDVQGHRAPGWPPHGGCVPQPLSLACNFRCGRAVPSTHVRDLVLPSAVARRWDCMQPPRPRQVATMTAESAVEGRRVNADFGAGRPARMSLASTRRPGRARGAMGATDAAPMYRLEPVFNVVGARGVLRRG